MNKEVISIHPFAKQSMKKDVESSLQELEQVLTNQLNSLRAIQQNPYSLLTMTEKELEEKQKYWEWLYTTMPKFNRTPANFGLWLEYLIEEAIKKGQHEMELALAVLQPTTPLSPSSLHYHAVKKNDQWEIGITQENQLLFTILPFQKQVKKNNYLFFAEPVTPSVVPSIDEQNKLKALDRSLWKAEMALGKPNLSKEERQRLHKETIHLYQEIQQLLIQQGTIQKEVVSESFLQIVTYLEALFLSYHYTLEEKPVNK